eukprot:483791_1
MKAVFILVLAVLLPLITFAGNCECDPDECLAECDCGNTNDTQECKDCVSSCKPTNEDCSNLMFILWIIGHVLSILSCLGYCKSDSYDKKPYLKAIVGLVSIMRIPWVYIFYELRL